MPCFSPGPTPGTPEYDKWLPEVNRQLDAFIHVVNYYFGKAGLPVPDGSRLAGDESLEEAKVLDQVLLHLDCDGVDKFQLNDMLCLAHNDTASKGHRYAGVLQRCFRAMRLGFAERPMNAAAWRACSTPSRLLEGAPGHASSRKLRLFAVACCRCFPELMANERSRGVVETAEQYADGHATVADLAAADEVTKAIGEIGKPRSAVAWVADGDAKKAAGGSALGGLRDSGLGRDMANLFHCVVGNPFRPVQFSPEWRTSTVVSLAKEMYESRDFSTMPVLADALQDAGCENEDVLSHCREPGPHTRGCWIVDLILQKS